MSVRVALIGCGRWGQNIGRNLSRLGVLAAICDENLAHASAYADEYGVSVRTLDEILADPAIDAVAIATPAITHAQVAEQAMRAGKHAFVEKPMAMQVAEAEALIRLAAKTSRVLMVGHLLQYHAAFRALLCEVEAGIIGPLRYVYSNRLSFGQIRTEENSLWSFAPHDLSMILTLMGDTPRNVYATGAAYVQPALPDVTTTHMEFGGGRRAHVFVSWLHPYKEQKLVVIGERGTLEFNDANDWSHKLVNYPHRVAWDGEFPTAKKAAAVPLSVEPVEPLFEEMRHFVDCVAGNATPRTDGAEALRVLQVLNLAQASLDAVLA